MDPQPEINHQPIAPLSTPEPPPKSKSWLIILLIIFCFASLAAAGYFYYQSQQLKKLTTTTAIQPPISPANEVPTDTSTPDPTADWKTYTNAAYSFSYNYPQSYPQSESAGSNSLQLVHQHNQSKSSFTINAVKSYPPNSPNFILDNKPQGTKTINDENWSYVYLPQGYEIPPADRPHPPTDTAPFKIKFFIKSSFTIWRII